MLVSVYLLFNHLEAWDACSTVGSTITDTIVAITNPARNSSVYAKSGYLTVSLAEACFNFTDLQPPVPYSIYRSQPSCATQLVTLSAIKLFYKTNTGPTTCDTTAPYRPLLALPEQIQAMDPAWASCTGAINGAWDPPIWLTPTDSVAAPTTPTPILPATTSFADPAPGLSAPAAPSTPAPGNPFSTASSDDQASTQQSTASTWSSQDSEGSLPAQTSIINQEQTNTTNALTILSEAEASTASGSQLPDVTAVRPSASRDPSIHTLPSTHV